VNTSFGPTGVSAAGRVAVYEGVSLVGAGVPSRAGMYLATEWPFASAKLILTLPRIIPAGRVDKLTSIHWLGDSSFLALGIRATSAALCQFCAVDTLETGVQVVLVRPVADSATVTLVPGTNRASSYSFVAPDTIYFTLNNDNRILRTRIGGGAIDSIFAFPPDSNVAPPGDRRGFPAVARGLQVSGHTAFAVIGGRFEYLPDSGSGEAQRDWGGHMHKVNLATGADTVMGYAPPIGLGFEYVWMRSPALSPDGQILTAEGRLVTLTQVFGGPPSFPWLRTDTTITSTGNIWQYVHP
jgi:hypothetical protein